MELIISKLDSESTLVLNVVFFWPDITSVVEQISFCSPSVQHSAHKLRDNLCVLPAKLHSPILTAFSPFNSTVTLPNFSVLRVSVMFS